MANVPPELCVIGRCDFGTGIGALTYGYAETLARHFPVCILPTEPHRRAETAIELPNGRLVPVWRGQALRASLYVDVIWNGVHDHNVDLVPPTGARLGLFVFDSDEVPTEWAEVFHDRFDAIVCCSPHLEKVLRASNVQTPVAVLPPPLDLEPLLRLPFRPARRRIRIGSMAAFHPRKDNIVLLRGFHAAFGRDDDDVELLFHSNLSFSRSLDELRDEIKHLGLGNVTVSASSLTSAQKSELLDGFDVYANFSRGEGYSIGPREALALGRPLALSAVGGHLDLQDCPGVFLASARFATPARYVEIDNRVFGTQRAVSIDAAASCLRDAVAFARSPHNAATAHSRRALAGLHGFGRSSVSAAELFGSQIGGMRHGASRPPHVKLPPAFRAAVNTRIVAAGDFSHIRRRVIQAHDGGFFSIFNTYLSHLVWDLRDDRCERCLPDWDVDRFIARQNGVEPHSFCYGRPGGGNVWTHLFEPLFGLSAEEMNSVGTLYEHASVPEDVFNTSREPLLTYIHAYDLYRTPWFSNFRSQYHRVWRDHIRLKAPIRRRVDAFLKQNFEGRVVLGAHVRHPSHAVEQPNAAMAETTAYIEALRQQISALERPAAEGGADWAIFLATDQARVVHRFQDEFGDRLCFFADVDRTQQEDDARYIADGDQCRTTMGHQLQHLRASSRDHWSERLALEVVSDAVVLASCRSLLHVVSNVSTAVSFINPQCELIFCKAGSALVSTGRDPLASARPA